MSAAILFIDDDANAGLIAQRMLESRGYEVVVARDGQEGLEWTRERSFDAIITDLMMPRMDGSDFCEQLLTEQPGLAAPILVMTGAPESWPLGEERFELIDKPLDLAALLERLEARLS